MLELVDLDRRISKETYAEVFPTLETRLALCQREARAAGAPIVIVFEGWDAAGKGTLINRLAQTLDPRGFKVHSTLAPTEPEKNRPWMWRFWNALPAAGNIAIFDRSWYRRVLDERVDGEVSAEAWQRGYDDIEQFERKLTDAGLVIIKFWLHISRKEQKSRFERITDDPATAWRIGKEEQRQHKHYDDWVAAVEEMVQRTDAPYAPWTIVEATHGRYARVKVFETIVHAIESESARRTAKPQTRPEPMPEPVVSPTATKSVLDRADLTASVSREDYDVEIEKLQERLFELEHRLYMARLPAVIAYEGWDAAGKGGNIRRLTHGLDPRGYEVIPIAAPAGDEATHHYLWRFWRAIPKAGHIAIFDRTWYGRVLVERVEGFCSEDEWKRAFREINDFERQLADFGAVLVKFWLQISPEEQLRRFQDRRENESKQWKITDEDWRNREKRKRYEVAVVEMLERTSTSYAPWTILEAECKLYARLKALRTVADAVEGALDRSPKK